MPPIRPSNNTVQKEPVITRILGEPRQLSNPTNKENPAVLTNAKAES